MRISCENKTNTNAYDHLLFTGTKMVESTVTKNTKYNMTGYTAILQHDTEFLESWELIKINRLSFARMSPEIKFMFRLGLNGMVVVQANELQEKIKQQQLANQIQPQPQQMQEQTEQTVETKDFVFNGKL